MRLGVVLLRLAALSTLLIGGISALVLARPDPGAGRVYTVPQVEAGLHQHPQAWLGRTIRLQALALPRWLPCGGGVGVPCGLGSDLLAVSALPSDGGWSVFYGGTVSPDQALLLHPEPDALLNRLRQLPGLGRVLPMPQSLFGDHIYRVTLQMAPTSALCPKAPCYWAVVPDAAPGNRPRHRRPFFTAVSR